MSCVNIATYACRTYILLQMFYGRLCSTMPSRNYLSVQSDFYVVPTRAKRHAWQTPQATLASSRGGARRLVDIGLHWR